VTVVERIRAERIVAVLRRLDDVDGVVDRLAEAGIGVVEVTLDAESALADIARLRGRGDVAVLAGTVRTPEDVDLAVDAGAEACVCPAFSGAVVARCHHHAVPVVPGALSPTEIEAAWRSGAALVKLFPARQGGPAYVRDVLQPLPDVPLVPTGGIDASNAAEYLGAGAVAVGTGSWLVSGDVATRARDLVAAVRDASE
jgi:2-dehydro-3-deoxyphosphogluconate aldolase/(4S)-4-hydroxy-2-oxoglutarate aldolase